MALKVYVSTDKASYFKTNVLRCEENPPTYGSYKVGDIIISSTQDNDVIGWVCTKSGEPGKWKSICDIYEVKRDLNTHEVEITRINNTLEIIEYLIDEMYLNVDHHDKKIKEIEANSTNNNALLQIGIEKNVEEINKLNERLLDIEGDVIDIVKNNIFDAVGDLEGLFSDSVKLLQNDVAQLHEDVENNTKNLSNLRKDVNTNITNIGNLNDQMNDVVADLNTIKNNIGDIVGDLEGDFSETVEQIQNQVLKNTNDIASINVKLNNFENVHNQLQERVNINTNAIGNINMTIRTLDDSIEMVEGNVEQLQEIVIGLQNTITANNNKLAQIDKNTNDIASIKQGLIDALINKGVDVNNNMTWEDLFGNLLDNLGNSENPEEPPSDSDISCTRIYFTEASITITDDQTYNLNDILVIEPSNCTEKVTWSTSSNAVVLVDGIVTALSTGSAIVQATCGSLSANINVIVNVVEEEEPKPDNGIVLFKDGTVYNDTIFRNLCLASNDGINGIFSDYMYYNLTHSRQHMWLSFDGYVDFNNYDRVDVTLYTEYSSQQPNLGIGIASKSGQCGYNSESTWEGIHQSYKTVMTNKTKTTYSLDINYTGAGYLLLWMNNGETNISGGVYITKIVVYPKEETPVEKPCTSIYFNNTTGFKITGSETLDLNQYLVVQPEGCTDDIIWTADSNAVAVSDGIVTVLKGGSAKIQARCGGYAATVTVEAVKEVGDGGIVLLSDGEYFNDTEFGSLYATPAIRDLIDSNGALVYEMNTIYTTAFFSFGGVDDSYVNFNNYDAVELTIYTENNNQVPYIQVCRTGGINGIPSGQFGYGSSPSGIMESTGFYVTTKKVPTVYTVNMAEIRKYEADMGNLLFIVERGETGDTADGKVYISKIVVYPEGTYYTEPIDE